MSRVLILQKAQDDIASISDYIAASNPQAAARFINDLFDRFELYATQPYMGEERSDLSAGLRCFSFGNYVTFFRPLSDGIRVVHILHGARKVGASDFL